MNPNDNIVKSGTWLYDGCVPLEVRITHGDMFYGSGDYEDSPEVREDQAISTFAVWYESTTQRGTFNAGGGQYRSLTDAIAATERTLQTKIDWR